MKKLLFFAAALLLAGAAAAQPRVQLGARAGIFSQDLVLNRAAFRGDSYMTDARMGFNAAIVSRIRLTAVGEGAFGLGLFFQPEVVYSQNGYKMQSTDEERGNGTVCRIRMQSVDIPVLVSAKVSVLRVQFGPVFNVMYKTDAVRGNIEMIAERPTVGYTVGASVDIFKGIVLDGRYNGEFKEFKNNIKAGETVYGSVKGSLSSWSVGLSFLL